MPYRGTQRLTITKPNPDGAVRCSRPVGDSGPRLGGSWAGGACKANVICIAVTMQTFGGGRRYAEPQSRVRVSPRSGAPQGSFVRSLWQRGLCSPHRGLSGRCTGSRACVRICSPPFIHGTLLARIVNMKEIFLYRRAAPSIPCQCRFTPRLVGGLVLVHRMAERCSLVRFLAVCACMLVGGKSLVPITARCRASYSYRGCTYRTVLSVIRRAGRI